MTISKEKILNTFTKAFPSYSCSIIKEKDSYEQKNILVALNDGEYISLKNEGNDCHFPIQEMAKALLRSVEKEEYKRDNKLQFFLEQLLYSNRNTTSSYITLLSAQLGFDLSTPHKVVLIETHESSLEEKLIKLIKATIPLTSNDLISQFGPRRIVMLISSKTLNIKERLNYISQYLKVAIGFEVSTTEEYIKSFHAAQLVLNNCKEGEVSTIKEKLAPFILSFVSDSYQNHFFKEEWEILSKDKELLRTATSLVENNMDLKSSAYDLKLHRNTIIFRTEKIKQLLNLNPMHRDSDRFHLALLIAYGKAQEEHKESSYNNSRA